MWKSGTLLVAISLTAFAAGCEEQKPAAKPAASPKVDLGSPSSSPKGDEGKPAATPPAKADGHK